MAEKQALFNADDQKKKNNTQLAVANYVRKMAVRNSSLVLSVTSEKSIKSWL